MVRRSVAAFIALTLLVGACSSGTTDTNTADTNAAAAATPAPPTATASAEPPTATAPPPSPTPTEQPTAPQLVEPRRIEVPGEIAGLEGIAVRQTDGRVYIGDLAEGSVWTGTNQPDSFTRFATSARRASAIGLAVDAEADRLYVATGTEGRLDVHDASSGELVSEIELDNADGGIINDVAVAPDGMVYITDSGRGRLFQYDPATGEVIVLVDAAVDDDIDGDVPSLQFNGLVAGDDYVLVMHMASGNLYRVDRRTGAAEAVLIDGIANPGRDGLLLCGDRLYSVVIAAFNDGVSAVRVIDLDAERRTGIFIEDLTSDTFSSAATLDYRDGELLVTNAQFGALVPDMPFWLTAVPAGC